LSPARRPLRGLLLAATLVGCAGAGSAPDPLAPVRFLVGTWTTTSGPSRTIEQWTADGAALSGAARTERDGDVVHREVLRLAPGPDGRLVYHAEPSGQAPTDFALTEHGPGRVRFEAPEHDFPQRIEYRRLDEDALEATVSGTTARGRRRLRWRFRRLPRD
jgi:hypothetical protein